MSPHIVADGSGECVKRYYFKLFCPLSLTRVSEKMLIGVHKLYYRAKLGEKLAFLGVKIDAEKNKIRGEEVEISTPDSPVKVFVIPTNEELVIARDTLAILNSLA